MLLYGAQILVPSVTVLNKMQRFWNRVLRWITNIFYATNIIVLSAEACLALIKLYLERIQKMTAIRITSAIPENNIATAMLPGGYPLVNPHRYPSNRRAYSRKEGGTRPRVWNSVAINPTQVRLPIDELGACAASI
jgi:hypothetical protein